MERQKKRDEIISRSARWFGKYDKDYESLFNSSTPNYGGGIAIFQGLDLPTLELLVSEGYTSMKERQNDSPTIAEFIQFMRDHPGFKANGYTVEETRDDFRVTITGLDFFGECPKEFLKDFKKFVKGASEKSLHKTIVRSWWD